MPFASLFAFSYRTRLSLWQVPVPTLKKFQLFQRCWALCSAQKYDLKTAVFHLRRKFVVSFFCTSVNPWHTLAPFALSKLAKMASFSLLPSGQDVWIQIKRWTMDHKKNAHWCERARYPHPPSDLTGQRHCLESCLELEIPVQMLTAEFVGPPREGGQEKQLEWCTRWPPK